MPEIKRFFYSLLIIIACVAISTACSGEDSDSDNTDGDIDAAEIEADSSELAEADADNSDSAEIESDGDTESAENTESEETAEEPETFPPDEQTPLYEKGLILPPNSLECIPVETGVAQTNCNHHGSSVAELPDGTVISVWYHGEAEKSLDSRLVWSRLSPGSDAWTPVEVLYDDPGLSEGNPTVWVDANSDIYVFFVTLYDFDWAKGKMRLIKSTDGGASWSQPVFLREDYCWNFRHHPLQMSNGELLVPAYDECLYVPVFLRSADKFETWTQEPEDISGDYLWDHFNQIQPALIELVDNTVSCITRDHTAARRIKRMTSDDFGATWTASEITGLPNSGTSVDHVRLLDGSIVTVFNNSPFSRYPLTVALSRDDGLSYIALRDIVNECDGGDCSYHYPSIMQSHIDGSIWVTYTHKRETIGWVHFNEAWLLEGTDHSIISCLEGELCADGACFEGCESVDECAEADTCTDGGCRKSCTCAGDCSEDQTCAESGFCATELDPQRVDQACTPFPPESWGK